jgi:His/Glu/Gln/Arg/opine family amino acid ABC transporter permease subunit
VIPFAYTVQWDVIRPAIGELWGGLRITIELSLLSFAFSLVLGLIVALCRMSPFRLLKGIAYVYVAVFRALSLYIYVLWIYFGIAGVFGINFNPLTAGVIALTIMNSAYMAEIYRSALGSVDPGQREAATSLGFGRVRGFATVIFPQGVRVAIPSLINQFIDIVKDSSIVSIIGTADLFGVTNRMVNFYRAPFELYTLVAFFYLTMVLAISALAAVLERRLQRHLIR